MSKKKAPPYIVQIQAEGTKAERDIIKGEIHKEAQKLAMEMPTSLADRLMYIRNLTQRALRRELDPEIFKAFIRLTNSYIELESIYSRAKLLSEIQSKTDKGVELYSRVRRKT